MLALYWYFDDASFEKINYKASTIGTLMMLSLKNMNYKASIIGILMMLALKNINYKARIIGILIMLALKYKAAIDFCLPPIK